MSYMDAWEQIIAEQERERDRLRVNQITLRVDDKKKSKRNVQQKEKVIEYGFVERDLYDENLYGRFELYFADRDTLLQQDRFGDEIAFGELIDEHAVATAIFSYLAEHYSPFLKEAPFAISYNPIAEAWIIEGTLPPGWLGGVIYIALAKENGKLLMMYGTR
ncbi:NTF2 fold immunity protein [Brevibacillus porteri]|uniref:NTF2 fold domain-containing protein n=1 Tax=Brevibacillus porteri TaxID=2126350 RepID=A0ABX5FQG7_9BACL|nr:NTF2 fold immunity protein [Brevibacillus porteri]MED1800460.1 NTF2 fold immunity protein [Brevibacillus porteri]MED2132643.1 NTF2 fold immunity protein [Brevibacillus porteri]MED2743348.1 NTF2 fold immunity protein [Brevibacillus porteri]MED2812522.1 NTF2 fold immunity protein [Brevibacillus porteri]MED2893968.1 NTF2 fold immunity protein [Brevibacillus porteri]